MTSKIATVLLAVAAVLPGFGSAQTSGDQDRVAQHVPTPSATGSLREMPDGRLFFEAYYRQYLTKDLDGAAAAYELLTQRPDSKYQLQAFTELLEIYRDRFRVDDVLRVLEVLEQHPRLRHKRKQLHDVIGSIKHVRARFEAQFEQARETFSADKTSLTERKLAAQSKERDALRNALLAAMGEQRDTRAQGGFLVPGDVAGFLRSAREEQRQDSQATRVHRHPDGPRRPPDSTARLDAEPDTAQSECQADKQRHGSEVP